MRLSTQTPCPPEKKLFASALNQLSQLTKKTSPGTCVAGLLKGCEQYHEMTTNEFFYLYSKERSYPSKEAINSLFRIANYLETLVSHYNHITQEDKEAGWWLQAISLIQSIFTTLTTAGCQTDLPTKDVCTLDLPILAREIMRIIDHLRSNTISTRNVTMIRGDWHKVEPEEIAAEIPFHVLKVTASAIIRTQLDRTDSLAPPPGSAHEVEAIESTLNTSNKTILDLPMLHKKIGSSHTSQGYVQRKTPQIRGWKMY